MTRKVNLLAAPALPLIALFCVSICWVVFVSLSSSTPRQLYSLPLTVENFIALFSETFVSRSIVRSIYLGTIATVIAVTIGYIVAGHISRHEKRKDLIVSGIFAVYMVSFVIKVYALQIILAPGGPVNEGLTASGLISGPIIFMGSELAVLIGLVYASLPISILVLLAQFEQMPDYYDDAAACFGANKWQRFWHVHLPLSMPGILTCIVFSLPPGIAAFEVPMLLGRGRVNMISTQIYQSSSGTAGADWPTAATLSILLLLISGGIILAIQSWLARRRVV
ncbi:ABC transporter permease [Mesorhizobium sp.]|uniref:ABC transporter permease n=1 Tax=Mesorhizobium sp. TaxID=1871066 RepID=UPI000FEA5932|nr:ABC transporter permease [Mesorhizobium sp.]RWJ32012.1 MAG: ABC transporter permease [Mesorhizobium sp.]TIQ73782.1 MAG: ABC transporter permease [Mesorhizobium sp.]